MNLSFNRRIELGIPRHADAIITPEETEAYPDWTLKVKPLEKVLRIPHDGGETLVFSDKKASLQLEREKYLMLAAAYPFYIVNRRMYQLYFY
jgi:hypothetical protein